MGIPLHLKMLANILNTRSKAFEVLILKTKILNGSILIESFLESKFEIYKTEKCKAITNTAENVVDNTRDDFWNNHKLAAIRYLLGNEEVLSNLFTYKTKFESFINQIRDHKDPHGLILYIGIDGKPMFTHHTFAEYLVADVIIGIIIDPNLQMIS